MVEEYPDCVESTPTTGVEVYEEHGWKNDPRIQVSDDFMFLGSIGMMKPGECSKHLDMEDYEGPRRWTKKDRVGNIKLSPEILEDSPSDVTKLRGLSIDDEELKVPVRYTENDDGSSPYFTGLLKLDESVQDVSIETNWEGTIEISLGKRYNISFLRENQYAGS